MNVKSFCFCCLLGIGALTASCSSENEVQSSGEGAISFDVTAETGFQSRALSEADYQMAVEASNILFGKATKESLMKLDEKTLLDVFAGVPQFEISRDVLSSGVKAVDLMAEFTQCFPSKGEMRKLTQGGGVSLNKEKLNAFDQMVTEEDLLDGKYLLVQRGKKNYYLIIVK